VALAKQPGKASASLAYRESPLTAAVQPIAMTGRSHLSRALRSPGRGDASKTRSRRNVLIRNTPMNSHVQRGGKLALRA
jgi:hypothetical protein